MTNSEAVELITNGIEKTNKPQRWVDLGCGSGTFTKALANILPTGSHIFAVDKNRQSLEKTMGNDVSIHFLKADFEKDDLDYVGKQWSALLNNSVQKLPLEWMDPLFAKIEETS